MALQIIVVKIIERECRISKDAIVKWKFKCRCLVAEYIIKYPKILVGKGSVVEIDESVFVKRKYNRGRNVRHQWVFGASKLVRDLIPVPNRSAETLLPIIRNYI